jgi:hypothetical protein
MALPLALPLFASTVIGGLGAISANNAANDAAAKETLARNEMNRLKEVYSNLDISNPFQNMTNRFTGLENTMEDLTVNQQEARFQRDTFQQSQANILSDLRQSAGGGGIAALAQELAQQGQIQAQKISASIGQQESMNVKAAAQEAARLQSAEAQAGASIDQMRAQGEANRQKAEMDRQATLLGMSQAETAAYMEQQQQAKTAMWDAIGGIGESFISAIPGLGGGGEKK